MVVTPGYRDLASQLDDPDLYRTADLVRETIATPGWQFLVNSIAEREQKAMIRLLNESTKAEDIPRLRGLVAGLRSIHEAATSILALADEREATARATLEKTK